VHANEHGDRRVDARELTEDARIAGIRESESAVLLGNRQPEKAGTRERTHDVFIYRFLFIEACGIDEAIVLHGA